MKKTKLWKKLAVLAVGATMLFSKTAAYAQEEQPVAQAESTTQTKSVQYFDLYARTEDGKPIDAIRIYAGEGNTQNSLDWGNILGWGGVLIDKNSGEWIWGETERTYDSISNATKDGYAKLLIQDESGGGYEGYYEGKIILVAPSNFGGLRVIKIQDWEGDLIGNIILEDTSAPYANYKVENLKEGWDISLSKSEITSFYENPVTGEKITGLGELSTGRAPFGAEWDGEPRVLLSITATRKSDARLTPASYEFDGTQDLVFKFDNALADDIKEVKEILFGVQDSVQSGEYLCDFTIDNYGTSYTYDLEKGELILDKSAVAALVYELYPAVGNTYVGQMTYTAADGTEKTVNGEWYVKVLEKSTDANDVYILDLSSGNTIVSLETFAILLEENKTKDVVIKTNNDVIFTFAKGTMKSVEGKDSYDFSTTIDYTYNKDLSSCVTSSNYVALINYSYSGELPAEASIRFYVGTQYSGKTLYYYLLNEDKTFVKVQNAVVDESGYVTVNQDHCSSYLLTSEELNPQDNGIVNNNTNKEAPNTGDNSMMLFYLLLAGMSAIVIVLVFGRLSNTRKPDVE